MSFPRQEGGGPPGPPSGKRSLFAVGEGNNFSSNRRNSQQRDSNLASSPRSTSSSQTSKLPSPSRDTLSSYPTLWQRAQSPQQQDEKEELYSPSSPSYQIEDDPLLPPYLRRALEGEDENDYRSNEDDDGIKSYKSTWWQILARWHVLFVFSYLSFVQCLVWFTYSSVPDEVKAYYPTISDSEIDLLLNWGPIIFIPALFIVSWMQNLSNGLRIAFWIGTTLTTTGAVIRTIPCWLSQDFRAHNHYALWFLHVGQILNAACGAVVLSLCSKLSVVWFPDNQRATATAISYTMNGAGTAVGFLLGPKVATSADKIPLLLYIHIAACAVPIIGGLIYFPERPKNPPSAIADAYTKGLNKDMGFFKGLKEALMNINFLVVVFIGGQLGGFTSGWQGILAQLLKPDHYNNDEAGNLGFATVMAGITGGIVAGPIADRFFNRKYKLFLLLLLGACCLTLAWWTLSLRTAYMEAIIPSNIWTLAISIALGGFFQGATGPLFYELCAELVYPVPESTSGGLMVLMYNAATVVMLFVTPLIDIGWMNTVETLSAIVALVLLIFVWEEYKRADAEAELKGGGIVDTLYAGSKDDAHSAPPSRPIHINA